jgi:holin-like protein
MKYMKQFMIILGVTCIGEALKYLIPLPIPASIYGLVIMMILLMTKVIKIEHVKETGCFLIETMSLMFIPAGVGLVTVWKQLQNILLPICIVTAITTLLVMVVTGKVADFLLEFKVGDLIHKFGGETDEPDAG